MSGHPSSPMDRCKMKLLASSSLKLHTLTHFTRHITWIIVSVWLIVTWSGSAWKPRLVKVNVPANLLRQQRYLHLTCLSSSLLPEFPRQRRRLTRIADAPTSTNHFPTNRYLIDTSWPYHTIMAEALLLSRHCHSQILSSWKLLYFLLGVWGSCLLGPKSDR